MRTTRDWQGKANQIEDVPDVHVTEDQKSKVRRLVAGWPEHDAAITNELMLMLGVHPSQALDEPPLLSPTSPMNRLMA